MVRLEIDDSMSEEVKRLLMRELELSGEDVYTVAGPLDLSGLWGLYELNRPDLKERLPAPVIPPALAKLPGDEGEVDIFRVIDEGDVLVQHPYESFASSVEAFIDQAVERSRRARHQADALPHVRARTAPSSAPSSAPPNPASRWSRSSS